MSTRESGVQWDCFMIGACHMTRDSPGMDLPDAVTQGMLSASRESLLTWFAQISPTITPFAKSTDVLNGSSEFHATAAGYLENVVRFGWTNGAYLKMNALLKQQKKIARLPHKAQKAADRKSTRLNSSHVLRSRMPSSA